MLIPPKVKNRKFLAVSNSFYDDYLKPNYWSKTAKDYKQILFKAGKPLQSRELNFLQSLFHDRIKTMCDINYRNGSIVEGCSILYNENEKNITVSDGIIYWDGTFFDFAMTDKNDISLSSKVLYIYLCPIYEVINSSVDKELNDPAIRYKIDEGVSGADRLKITFEIKTSNEQLLPEQKILIGAVDSNGNISLLNRNYKFDENTNVGQTEVLNGLKIRNNKTYYEVETGHGTIKGNDVVYNGYKRIDVETLRKEFDIKEETAMNTEIKPLDIRENPLKGCIWCDIKYDTNKDMEFNGMLLPGQDIEIIALTTDNKTIPLCTANIAETYLIGNKQEMININETTPIATKIINEIKEYEMIVSDENEIDIDSMVEAKWNKLTTR